MSNILIIDDSRTERELMAKVIKDAGHKVEMAMNGQEGLEKAKSEVPDLILLDVVMPKMDGFAVCRKLSKDPATKGIPVILISTKNTDTDKVWGKRQGASDYLTKPFDPTELEAVVRELLS